MPQVLTLPSGGPYKGVRNNLDPYFQDKSYLQDALNLYIPDCLRGSQALARPGFGLSDDNLDGRVGQGVYPVADNDGTVYNFLIAGGKVYRADSTLEVYTDVTPVGVTISSTARRVYLESFGDYLCVNDETNRPWLGTDLGATPITGTYIDFDGSGTAWQALGQPTIYAGSLVFILKSVNGVGAQTDITWSSPGDPTEGYQQPDFDYRWTLEQTGSAPLFGIWGTNVQLYYWRQFSIGALSGTPGPDFQTTSTHDAIAANIGLTQSSTIDEYNDTIFFCDYIGRPWALPIGGKPEAIWLNMTEVVNNATSAYPSTVQVVATGCIEPNLNAYIAAIWSPQPGVSAAPTQMQVFDGKTKEYMGRWQIGEGTSVEAMGVLRNADGSGRLVVIGSNAAPPTTSGYVWIQSAVEGGDGLDFLTTEDGEFLTTEDLETLTTEDVVVSWKDNDQVPDIQAHSLRLGYSDDYILNVDSATIITSNDSPVTISMITPSQADTVEGTPSPSASQDDTYRQVVGSTSVGRGVQVIASPTEAESQWGVQSMSIKARPTKADPSDP